MAFDQPATLLMFFLKGLPSLCNLFLHRCALDGTWQDFFQSLSDSKNFKLKNVEVSELNDLLDTPDGSFQIGPGAQGTNIQTFSVPSIVPNHALLHFINNPGSHNPFKYRTWRLFDADEHQNTIVTGIYKPTDDDEFEDMSEWEWGPEYEQSMNFELDDPDGPEYKSDYDFDAESDSDELSETSGDIDMEEVE